MEALTMQDIELCNVEVNQPLMRSLSLSEEDQLNVDRIETKFGPLSVFRQGVELTSSKPVLITYHDIGLNHVSNFQAFFNFMDMKLLLRSISLIHINAPGQEENAPNFPDNYVFPTLDEMAEQITDVITFYQIKHFIGFGVGAGANILSRFALANPSICDGLFLINPTCGAPSWSEWFYQKFNVYSLGLSGQSWSLANPFPDSYRDYLLWHHFGKVTEERNRDLIQMYRSYFANKSVSPRNLALFIDSFIKRNDINLVRGDEKQNFQCPTLLLCGAFSPHVEESVQMNARLNPANSTWMKLQDCGMVLEEQPGKVAEALKLFIQGLGYSLTAYERRRSSLRKLSAASSVSSSQSDDAKTFANPLNPVPEKSAAMKITENGDIKEVEEEQASSKSIEDIRIVTNPIQC